MHVHRSRPSTQHGTVIKRSTVVLAATALLGGAFAASPAATSSGSNSGHAPRLVGRAVLPAATLAEGPPSGAFVIPGPGTVRGITFPLPSQPVEGFSSIVSGRHRGEYLAMPDNGFGSKTNSTDFLIRAYYIRPHFKTASGGSGTVDVGDFISFRDPDNLIGFPIVNEGTERRLLTGGDIDPESLQRGRNGDLWVGDEFGPWILHFSGGGRLLDPPFALPGGLMSPNNPFLKGTATILNSRGLEAMAITPDRRYLYAALEGATVADLDQSRRYVYQFDTVHQEFTGQVLQYRTEAKTNMVADMWAVDNHRVVVIERDGGFGLAALFRSVYLVDLRHTDPDGFLRKTLVLDLTAIPDPDLISLPPLHAGDVGLGDPFRVVCESVEAIHVMSARRLLIGCDNNLPNAGRNPALADDTELIVVAVPKLRAHAS
jgi:glycerophosphoryl diester phosphodiesterase